MRMHLLLALSLAATASAQIHPPRFREAVVVSDSELASKAGAEIMRRGGNAVDAAVATGFALAVTYPTAGNIGGGGFMLIRLADGKTAALDYREVAPGRAARNMYLDAGGQVPKDASTVGYRAAAVPGSVAGLREAHRRYGKLPWKDVVEPARRLAGEGFVVSHYLARSLRAQASLFRRFPESNRVLTRGGRFYAWGERFRQPELAATLLRIRDGGAAGFYRGPIARLIAQDMRANGGMIDEEDLRRYRPVWRETLRGRYRNLEVIAMPPPSSGGAVLIEMLNVLEGFPLGTMGFGASATVHVMAETMKRAFADRAAHFGDPDFVRVPVAELTSRAYAERLRAQISLERATPAGEIRPWAEPLREGNHTTHYSVVDRDGNAVSTTTTINTSYGSGAMVKGAGFLLNNEMDDFAVKVGAPNAYGLIQGEANAIAPGKRPLSSMTPTIVTRGGRLAYVLGSPGGPTIINTVLQTIVNVADHGMNIQQAVAAPRFHHQWLPDEIRAEARMLPDDVRGALLARGHRFARSTAAMGSCHAIAVDPGGHRLAGLDPRVGGAGAAGY